MKYILGFLIISAIFNINLKADSAEILMVTIVSIDQDSGKMTVVINDKTKREITIVFDSKSLPPCIEKSKNARVWGEFSNDEKNIFNASCIRKGCSCQNACDCTGIRSRIKRSCSNEKCSYKKNCIKNSIR
ncbi:MAG: hypothetical protein HQK76_10790 [Desulfobacterales bacterium]|nr:hypothetical protein [Desulfobacterales bacterium]